MKVFTPEQMRAFDAEAVSRYGIPSLLLMEQASLRVAEFLLASFAPLAEKRILILCGKGNNGGDGLALARHLQHANVGTFLLASPESLQGDARSQWDIASKSSLELHVAPPGEAGPQNLLRHYLRNADIVVDAVLGTGFRGDLRPGLAEILDAVQKSHATIVAVDVPSGLDALTGEVAQGALKAHHTVTLAGPKTGFFVNQVPEYCGNVWVGSIGTPSCQMSGTQTNCETLGASEALAWLPFRRRDAHKGDAGRTLLIGGSFGMSGAMVLACRAALKAGAGLCLTAVPHPALPMVATGCPEATSHPLPANDDGSLNLGAREELESLWTDTSAVAIGPGLSRAPEALELVRHVLEHCPHPVVVDADALYALPGHETLVRNRQGRTILTPHPGEMGHLMGQSAAEVNRDRFAIVRACAARYGAHVVLKGSHSLVATPEGLVRVNLSGNPGMATGGSGDALTGLITGLLAQTRNVEGSAALAVYAHGRAGDLAFAELGNGLIAGDIVAHIPRALAGLYPGATIAPAQRRDLSPWIQRLG